MGGFPLDLLRKGCGVFAQTTTTTSVDSGLSVGVLLMYFIVIWVVIGLPTYFVFKKAGPNGDPAWGAFVPIYGFYLMLKVVGRPGWWLLLLLVPFVNYIILIMVYNDLSKSFGHGVGFTLGLIFLSWIFLAILAWGSSQYQGPAAAVGGAAAMAPPPPPPPAT